MLLYLDFISSIQTLLSLHILPMINDPTCIASLCGLCQFHINPDKKIAICMLFLGCFPTSYEGIICVLIFVKTNLRIGYDWFQTRQTSGSYAMDKTATTQKDFNWNHLQCLSMSALRTPQGLIEATRHTFQSPQEEKSRRRNWLEDSLASQLSKTFTASKSNCTGSFRSRCA